MKQIMKFTLIGLMALGVTSCELFNIDFDTTLSGALNIVTDDAAVKSDGFPFYAEASINPLEDDEVEQYADKIVEATVDGILAEVESVSETGVVIYSGSTFTISNSTKSATLTVATDWPIEVGTTLTLDDVGGAYDDIADILLDLDVFTIVADGTASHAGVYITVRIDIETTITGNPF